MFTTQLAWALFTMIIVRFLLLFFIYIFIGRIGYCNWLLDADHIIRQPLNTSLLEHTLQGHSLLEHWFWRFRLTLNTLARQVSEVLEFSVYKHFVFVMISQIDIVEVGPTA